MGRINHAFWTAGLIDAPSVAAAPSSAPPFAARSLVAAGLAIAMFAATMLTTTSGFAQECPEVEIVVDNDAGGSGYSEEQANNWASRPTGSCLGTYRYLSHDDAVAPNNDGSRKGKAIWKPTVTVTGNYEVIVSYRATENRTNDADYYVHDDNGGIEHHVIDQAHDGDCTEVSLGTVYCTAGGNCQVVLDGTDDNQSDAADATTFKLVDCDDPPPPSEACDNIANAAGYELCAETATTCAGVYTNGAGCNAFCAAAGMECVARFGGEPGCNKEPQNPLSCDEDNDHESDWCECSYPPGYNPTTGAGGAGGSLPGAGGAGGALPATSSSSTSAVTAVTVGAGGSGGSSDLGADDATASSGCGVAATKGSATGSPWPDSRAWLLALAAIAALQRRRFSQA